MAANVTSTLVLLKTLYASNLDYVSILIYLSQVALSELPLSDRIDTRGLQNRIRVEFGLEIPLETARLILARMQKQGHFIKSNGNYFLKQRIVAKHDYPLQRSQALEREKEFIGEFCKFAGTEFGVDWQDIEARSALLKYVEEYGIESISVYEGSLPEVRRGDTPDNGVYVVNAFIRRLRKESSSLFQTAIDLVKGTMIANALLCSEYDSFSQKLRGVQFYLDTPLVLQGLGYEGEVLRSSLADLIYLLNHQQAEVWIFHHTFLEIEEALRGLENALNGKVDGYSAMYRHFVEHGLNASDVALEIANLEINLAAYGVKVRSAHPIDLTYAIDEPELDRVVSQRVNYYRDLSKQRDLSSIRAIYGLRNGKSPSKLEDAVAVLVTTNDGLASAARDFGRKYAQSENISAVITAYEATNVVWLKSPMRKPDLPMHILAAKCIAAVSLPEKTWETFGAEADKLRKQGVISNDIYDVLRLSPQVREELADLTYGGAVEFDPKSLPDIIERVTKDIELPLQSKITELEEEKSVTDVKLLGEQELNRALVRRLFVVSGYLSFGIMLFATVTILFALAFVLVIPLLHDALPSDQQQNIPAWVLLATTVTATAVGFINLVSGGSVLGLIRRLHQWLKPRVFGGISRLLKIPLDRQQIPTE